MKKTAVFAILSLFAMGCATNNYSITYESFPQSAMVVCGGIQKGYTPLTRYYHTIEQLDGAVAVPCKAVWMSGVDAKFNQISSIDELSKRVLLKAERPKNRAGIQGDLQFDYQKKADDQRRKAQERADNIRKNNLKLQADKLRLEDERLKIQKKQLEIERKK